MKNQNQDFLYNLEQNFSYNFTTLASNKILDHLALLSDLNENNSGLVKALKKEAVKRGIHIQQPNLFI